MSIVPARCDSRASPEHVGRRRRGRRASAGPVTADVGEHLDACAAEPDLGEDRGDRRRRARRARGRIRAVRARPGVPSTRRSTSRPGSPHSRRRRTRHDGATRSRGRRVGPPRKTRSWISDRAQVCARPHAQQRVTRSRPAAPLASRADAAGRGRARRGSSSRLRIRNEELLPRVRADRVPEQRGIVALRQTGDAAGVLCTSPTPRRQVGDADSASPRRRRSLRRARWDPAPGTRAYEGSRRAPRGRPARALLALCPSRLLQEPRG